MSTIYCKSWDVFLRLRETLKGHYIFINPDLTSTIHLDTTTPELFHECYEVLSELGYTKPIPVLNSMCVPELFELNPYPTYLRT